MSLAEVSPRQDDAVAGVLRKLAVVWTDFEGRLEATPLIRKLTRGRFELVDYHAFLINLRQQVKDGSLWMSRAASSIGSEALSAWMFHEASRPNPFGLLGAMFIIEGLGSIKAAEWGRLAKSRLGLPEDAFRFLLYHGENDAEHMQEFEDMLRLVLPDAATAARIVTCAKVTARLYALQIEEIVA